MAQFIFTDNATSTLATAISSASTTIVLSPGTGAKFPNPGSGQQFAMTLNDAATKLVFETVYVTAISGDTCTVIRGQEGTTAVGWVIGDYIFHGPTSGTQAAFGQTATANTWTGANTFTQPVTGAQVTTYNELLRADQSIEWNIRTISSNYTIISTDAGQLLNIYNSASPSTNYTISLPAPSSMTLAKISFVVGQFIATFTTASGIIWGYSFNTATITVPKQTFLTLQSDGTNWVVTKHVPSVYTWDISAPPPDVHLLPTQRARISFNGATNIPFSIATDQAFYKLTLICSSSTVLNPDLVFYPNNTSYSSAFASFSTLANDYSLTALGTSTAQPIFTFYTTAPYGGNITVTSRTISNGFFIDLFAGPNTSDNINDRGPFILEGVFCTATAGKMLKLSGGIYGGPGVSMHFWPDTLTSWTSLGTLSSSSPGGMTGYVIIERLDV